MAQIDSLEKSILLLSGLEESQFNSYDLLIDPVRQESLHVIECGDSSKPILLMLHGYGAASVLFYKLFAKLSRTFFIISIDLRGFGRSTRVPFTAVGVEETEEWLLWGISQAVTQLGLEDNKFFLTGHSLGGYLATLYAAKNPTQISQLFLLSPLGFKLEPEDWTADINQWSWFAKKSYDCFRYLMENNWTPFDFLRKSGPFKKELLQKYTRNRFPLKNKELSLVEEYLLQVNSQEGSGEYCINQLLLNYWPRRSLHKVVEEMEVPTILIFGYQDWIFDPSVYDLLNDNHNLQLRIVKNAGHQLILENADLTTDVIIGDFRQHVKKAE